MSGLILPGHVRKEREQSQVKSQQQNLETELLEKVKPYLNTVTQIDSSIQEFLKSGGENGFLALILQPSIKFILQNNFAQLMPYLLQEICRSDRNQIVMALQKIANNRLARVDAGLELLDKDSYQAALADLFAVAQQLPAPQVQLAMNLPDIPQPKVETPAKKETTSSTSS